MFLYKLKSNPTYKKSTIILDEGKGHKNSENDKFIRPFGFDLLEQTRES